MTHLSVPDERKKALGITDNLVRVSIGIENADDLIADFDQALAAVWYEGGTLIAFDRFTLFCVSYPCHTRIPGHIRARPRGPSWMADQADRQTGGEGKHVS